MSTQPLALPISPLDAISAFEAAQTLYNNDASAESAAQAKADAATLALNSATSDRKDAAVQLNGTIDVVIQALTSVKVPVE